MCVEYITVLFFVLFYQNISIFSIILSKIYTRFQNLKIMWSSTIRSIAFKIPKTLRRSYSFLGSFCKKDDNKSDSDTSVSVELQNVSGWYNTFYWTILKIRFFRLSNCTIWKRSLNLRYAWLRAWLCTCIHKCKPYAEWRILWPICIKINPYEAFVICMWVRKPVVWVRAGVL